VVAATLLATSITIVVGSTAGAGERREVASATTNGVWPGLGKICEPGAGGASSVRGVSTNTIHIAVFNDSSNTILPGLGHEFVTQATAFADWCNATGGINGRHIVIDDRDSALFNSAQVTNQACQIDFMAVGGGMALDQPSVPVREQCGLGQITGFTVSDAAVTATDQVNPSNTSLQYVSAGWFAALAKKYPQAVKKAAMGAANEASDLEPQRKWADAAGALGWNVTEFQETPLSVTDWTSYIQQLQTKGVEAVWPPDPATLAPYLQAMSTAGYAPAFVATSTQYYDAATTKALVGLHTPPLYLETAWWPLEMASQNSSTEQLVQIMHKYEKGSEIDFYTQEGAESWLLWAKAASACGENLTVSCVLSGAQQKNWSAGGMQAPVSQVTLSSQNPHPSPCFALLQAEPNKFVYNKPVTQPTESIWNCNPKNVVTLTSRQLAAISG
jgi:ABC-type branched-subunit amino acid transport system substrate-binding protein